MTLPDTNTAARLGSEDDWIRQSLFGCQSMNELLQHVSLSGSGPFQAISDADRFANEGKPEDAKSILRAILNDPNLETRVELWVWSAMRGLGQQPEPEFAFEVLGTVLEVPLQGAYDSLAAYKDGTARYLNFSGKAVFWDSKDETILAMCEALIQAAISVASQARPRVSVSLPKTGRQITLLTRSGMFAISDPPVSLINGAAGLMNELIRKASAKRAEGAGPADPAHP